MLRIIAALTPEAGALSERKLVRLDSACRRLISSFSGQFEEMKGNPALVWIAIGISKADRYGTYQSVFWNLSPICGV
jgi:hypothetical protein